MNPVETKYEILCKEKSRVWDNSWHLYTTHFQGMSYPEALKALDLVRSMPQNQDYYFVIGSDY